MKFKMKKNLWCPQNRTKYISFIKAQFRSQDKNDDNNSPSESKDTQSDSLLYGFTTSLKIYNHKITMSIPNGPQAFSYSEAPLYLC